MTRPTGFHASGSWCPLTAVLEFDIFRRDYFVDRYKWISKGLVSVRSMDPSTKSFALTPDKRQRIMNLLQMTGGASYHQTVSSYPLAAIIFLFSLASAASLQLGLYKLLLFAISHRAPSGADVETPNLVIKGNLKWSVLIWYVFWASSESLLFMRCWIYINCLKARLPYPLTFNSHL